MRAPRGLEVGDLRGRQASVGGVDLLRLQRRDHLRGVREVADGHGLVLAVGEARVARVGGEHRLGALLVRVEHVRAGAGDLVALADLVGRVVLGRDERGGGRAEDVREGGVRGVQVEDDRQRVRRLDLVEGAEESLGTDVGADGPDPVEGVLDRLGVERLAVGELQALAQGAPVGLARRVRELAVLGRVGLGLAGARREGQQGLVDVPVQLPGAVPRGRGIEGARCARGTDDDPLHIVAVVLRQQAASGEQGYGRKGRRDLQASGPVEHVHAPRSARGAADPTAVPHESNGLVS